jgi:hypothetical protein
MRKTHRYITAIVLCVLYGLIVFSPLAPLALRSTVIVHALTGECAGECGLCGCAPERSASHTCCCWQKKLQQEHDDQDEPDCCKTNKTSQNKKSPFVSSRPCGSSKTMALTGAEQSDVLPFRFSQGILALVETPLFKNNPVSLTNRPSDPPDPPPKLS